jgi:hypothetical protein
MRKESSEALSAAEISALDMLILGAIQRGVDPKQPLMFIEAIVATHDITQAVTEIISVVDCTMTDQQIVATQNIHDVTPEILAAVGGTLDAGRAGAMRELLLCTARIPGVTLRQLIELRRQGIERQSRE